MILDDATRNIKKMKFVSPTSANERSDESLSPSLRFPLPPASFPTTLQRFISADVPVVAQKMAASGTLPIALHEKVSVMLQLQHAAESVVREAAHLALQKLSEDDWAACAADTSMPAVLHALALGLWRCASGEEEQGAQHGAGAVSLPGAAVSFPGAAVFDVLLRNPALSSETWVELARHADVQQAEALALNQERLQREPEVIEALYHNPATRMSTVDRLIELAVRCGMELKGIGNFAEHVEALSQQMIFASDQLGVDAPHARGSLLPRDRQFEEALREGDEDYDVSEIDEGEGKETVRQKFVPLQNRITTMALSEKLRLAMVGNASARALLVRDRNKNVAMSAIRSPKMNEAEATTIAHSREVSEDVLGYIGRKREWLRGYELKRALVFNPRSPLGTALRFIEHLRDADLKKLAKSRHVVGAVKTAAVQRIQRKEKKK